MTVDVDYQGATSFVALIRSIEHWHELAEWPAYEVAHISMVEQAEQWLPDGIVVLEWRGEPDDDELRLALLGRPR